MQAHDKSTEIEANLDHAAESTEPAETVADITPSLEEMIHLAELKAEEHHDAWLRAKAETENVRRRAQEDIAKASKYAIDRFAGELLAVREDMRKPPLPFVLYTVKRGNCQKIGIFVGWNAPAIV